MNSRVERNLAVRISVMEGGKVKAELREIGTDGEKSLKKIELAGQPASKSLLALNAAANDVRGSITGLTSRMGPLGSALRVIGPVGLAAGAALAAVGIGIGASLREAAIAEESYNRLSAAMKTTGNATGLTTRQIAEFADGIEKTTMATAEQVQDAAVALTRFRSISGEAFTRTLKLSQDLAASIGGDMQSNILLLGRALEDPVDKLTALQRAGINFTDSQKEMIKTLTETGKQAEAQKYILDTLEGTFGGIGAGSAQGLTGATKMFSDAWGGLLEDLGKTGPVAGTAVAALNTITTALNTMRGWLAEDPIGTQIEKMQAKIQKSEQVLANYRKTQESSPFAMLGNVISREEQRIEKLRQELNQIVTEGQKQISEEHAAKMAAEAAARQRNLDLISQHRTKIDDALDKLSSDPADKIAKVNKELEATKTRLDALRQVDGSNAAPIDAAIAQAETLARKQIEAIEKPAMEAATRAAQANQKVMDDLQKQISNMGNKRQAFVDQAVGRLSEEASAAQKQQAASLAAQIFDSQAYREGQKVVDDLNNQMLRLTMDKRSAFVQDALSRMSDGASAAQRAEVEKLAAALYDQGEAQERLNKLKAEGEQITNATRTATEVYAAEIARLNELLEAGAISQEVYNRAVANAERQQLAARKDAQAGAIRAFNAYREQGEDAASAVEKAFTDAMGATEDAIVNLVMSGGDSLKSLGDLANSIVAEITRMAVKQAITGPLFNAIGGSMGGGGGGFLDSIFSMIFHEGGVVGDGLPKRRAVPAHVFIGAPRYHGGGIAGLKPGEIPAILERGETVLPKNQRMGGASTVIMNISTPDANSFRSSQAQIAADAARGIDRARRNL